MGRCRPRHVHQQRAGVTQIQVVSVELEPIGWYPVIAGITAKDRARLKANHCFAPTPDPSGEDSVTGRNEWIAAVTGHAANSPYGAAPYTNVADGAGGPCCYAGWVIYRHAHQPAMIAVAIRHAPIPNVKNVAYDAERRPLLLDRCSEGRAVVLSRQRHVHRPAWVDGARVHVKRNDVMFDGRAAIGCNHCVQKKRPRSKIDNGRADDAHGTDLSATEIGCGHRSAHILLPDNGAVHCVERIHVIRFGDCNDHRAAWTALDVKRLRVNVAYDRPVKV